MNDAPSASAKHYTGSLVVIGALAALITALIVLLLSHGVAVAPAGSGSGGQNLWLFALVAAPLGAALAAMGLAWLAIRFVRVLAYLRALRAYCERELRRAGVPGRRSLLHVEIETRADDSASAIQPGVAQRIEALPRVTLVGAEGAGKSVMLLALALRQCGPVSAFWTALGLGRIPALVSLPGLAETLAAGSSADAYVARGFARFGANGLAARATGMMRRGSVMLLCDDYDMLDQTERERVDGALQEWAREPFQRLQVVVACDRDRFERDLDGLGALASAPEALLLPLSAAERSRMSARVSGVTPDPLTSPIGPLLAIPAIARARADCLGAGQTPGRGLGLLVRQQLLVRRDRLADSSEDRDAALVWAALAASFQGAGRYWLPLDPSRLMGECAADWLVAHEPVMPVSFALQPQLEFAADALEYGLKAGIESGVLRRQVDGLGLVFAHPWMRKAAAAYWLDAMDNGLGRMNSDLLAPEWASPVTLWASARADALDIAQRIYRLAQAPESVARRAGFTRGSDVAPVILALALAVAVEGAAPQLLGLSDDGATNTRRSFAIQQALRDLLDATAIMAADTTRRRPLMDALRQMRLRVGPTLLASMRALIGMDALDRLARAHLTLALGLIATPDALEELLRVAGRQDLTLRQAARQALVYAGAGAIPTLQDIAVSSDASLRHQASEALSLVTAATPEATDVAGAAAYSGLRSADPGQRRVAVTTLSAIRASDALDALIARLDDTSLEVRVAAAAALGQLGAPAGFAALRRRAHDAAPELRRAVAEALGMAPEPPSVAPLLALLGDREPTVRVAAATSLGGMGDQRAAGPLREAAHDRDPWVRQAAQAAVRRLTGGVSLR